MNWSDFFTGVIAGWILSLFITIIVLYLRLKAYDRHDDDD